MHKNHGCKDFVEFVEVALLRQWWIFLLKAYFIAIRDISTISTWWKRSKERKIYLFQHNTHMNHKSDAFFHLKFHVFFSRVFLWIPRISPICSPVSFRSTTWFHEEQVDGEATVKWMRRQAWCNGKVGVTGDSVGASVGFGGASVASAWCAW